MSATDASMLAHHLKHWRAQMTMLRDSLMNKEISVDEFHRQAYPLQKKIKDAEAKLPPDSEPDSPDVKDVKDPGPDFPLPREGPGGKGDDE